MSDENKILLIGGLCEHCGALVFKNEKERPVHNCC
jgi:hypothetical protein